jgi:RHS repeat-associated protein
MPRALLPSRTPVFILAILAATVLAVAALAVAALPAGASVGAATLESAGVRAVLARELQLPGPAVVSQGGSSGAGSTALPAGELVPGSSTAFSDTYSSPGKPLVSRFFASPVNYRGSDGQWHAIGDQLVASALGGYENAANSFLLQIPDSLSSAVSLTSEGRSVSFTLEGASTALPAVSGDTASCGEVLPSTDLAYASRTSGVLETATLKGSGAPEQLRYVLSASGGLTPREEADGSIVLADGQGTVWFTIPAPVAYSPGAGVESGRALSSTLTASGSSWILSVDTSASWLREMLASGAVAVDPTLEVSGTQECEITADTPTRGYCASTEFQVGYDSTHMVHHGLEQFNLSSLPAAALILNAKLGLYVEAKSTSNSKAVGVYRVTKPWTTSATWETYDGTHAWSTHGGDYANPETKSDASVNPSVGASTGWYYWYPTRMVQEWINGTNAPEGEGYANQGLIVKDKTDNETKNLLSIASSNAASHKPYIEIAYEPRGFGAEPQYTQLSTPLTDKLTASVNAASGNLMLQNEDLHIPGTNGVDYTSTRTFNNLNPEVHDYGRWGDSNFLQLEEHADGAMVLNSASDATFLFEKQSNGTYVTPPGIKATLCTAGHEPCPTTLPSGVTYRVVYHQSGSYVDFTSFGWAYDQSDRYGNKLQAGYTEGIGNITSWTDTQSRKIEYVSVAGHFPSELKDLAGSRHVSYAYEGEGAGAQLTSYTDANGNTTHYHYESGNLNKITTPKGNVILLAYDSHHRIEQLIRTTNSEHTTGPTTKFVYYEAGSAPSPCTSKQKATVVKDADWTTSAAHETLYCANVLDEVEKTIDAAGNESTASFDPFGNRTFSTAAAPGTGLSGNAESFVYDEAGQNALCAITGTSSTYSTCPSTPNTSALVDTFKYKDETNAFSATQLENPEGHSVFACYNQGHQTESEGPACPGSGSEPAGSLQNENDQLTEQHELKFAYNSNGTIGSSTDADGHSTSYEYEGGNLKKIVPPTGSTLGSTTIAVDADSRPHTVTDGAGHIATIAYDKLDRATEIAYTGTGTAKTVKFEYDADGNIAKREDSTGTTRYTVDPLNRITKEELPGSLSNSYEYDAASNMTSFTDGGGKTSYAYNGLDELESMKEPGESTSTTFAYDNDHRLNQINYTSGAKEVYKLEPTTGRPETITAESVTGTTVPKFTYAYKEGEDDASLVQKLTESTGSASTYAYDKLNRLKSAVTTGTNPSLYEFKLDGAGNRTQQTVNPTGSTGGTNTYYVLNSGNLLACRQTVAPPCSGNSSTELSAYTYDGAGDETAITPKSDTSGATFAYNAASELSSLTPSGSGALALSYGGTGQDDLTALGSTTTLQNSQLGLTREVNSAGTSYYARTPNGLLIDQRTPSGHFNPLYDGQGDIVGLVNSSAKVERTFRYGPYGENTHSEGTQTIPYPFGYKSGYRMPGGNTGLGNVTNGLYHYGQRYYDPTTGRWTQRDPLDHLSSTTQGDRFLFVGGDPTNLSDPSGREGIISEIEGEVKRMVEHPETVAVCYKFNVAAGICEALVEPSETSTYE